MLVPTPSRTLALPLASAYALRGRPAAQQSLQWPEKDPADDLDYWVDATNAFSATDPVASFVPRIDPASGIVATGYQVLGQFVCLWLSGGAAGAATQIGLSITSLSGLTLTISVGLAVTAGSPADALPNTGLVLASVSPGDLCIGLHPVTIGGKLIHFGAYAPAPAINAADELVIGDAVVTIGGVPLDFGQAA